MTSGIMVDWITGQIEATTDGQGRTSYPALFDTGRFQKIAPTGEILEQFSGRHAYEGSHNSAITFRSPLPHVLELSGNPVKFLQGHNLFGSDDRLGLFMSAGVACERFTGGQESFNKFPTPEMWQEFEFLRPRFTRLDLTRSYRFESNAHAREWIRGCASTARTKHKSGLAKQGTVYMGQSSTRWAFKIYAKADEINSGLRGHRLSDKLEDEHFRLLTDWAEGIVRFELTLRSPEIKKLPYDFDASTVWGTYFDRIRFNQNQGLFMTDDLDRLVDEFGEPMPGHLKMCIIAWRAGNDPKRIYSKNQYYRNLSALRKWNYDISIPYDSDLKMHVETELDPSRWDPEPIHELIYKPDQERLREFGLLPADQVPDGLFRF